MADFYGVNKTRQRANPRENVPAGEHNGEVRVVYDEFTFPDDIFSASDFILMALDVPKGARILEACIISPDLGGSTGKFSLGAPGALTSLITESDPGGQAVKTLAGAGNADLGKKLLADTSYQLDCTEATDDAAGLTIQAWIMYVLI